MAGAPAEGKALWKDDRMWRAPSTRSWRVGASSARHACMGFQLWLYRAQSTITKAPMAEGSCCTKVSPLMMTSLCIGLPICSCQLRVVPMDALA